MPKPTQFLFRGTLERREALVDQLVSVADAFMITPIPRPMFTIDRSTPGDFYIVAVALSAPALTDLRHLGLGLELL